MRTKLEAAFSPLHLRIVDESAQHAGHKGAQPGSETHFRIEIVADKFAGLSRIDRHRLVHDSMKEFFRDGLHALAIHAKSPNE